MKTMMAVLVAGALLAPTSNAQSQTVSRSFSFHAESIGDAVFLTGGGTFDPQSGRLQGGGGFRSVKDIVSGPLAGCRAGEGVRWEAVEILPSSGFKCSGAAEEPVKTATTDDDTLVLQARFFRQGDGINASFTAKMFVSAVDEDPNAPGIQNVWIQGVGCTEGTVHVR